MSPRLTFLSWPSCHKTLGGDSCGTKRTLRGPGLTLGAQELSHPPINYLWGAQASLKILRRFVTRVKSYSSFSRGHTDVLCSLQPVKNLGSCRPVAESTSVPRMQPSDCHSGKVQCHPKIKIVDEHSLKKLNNNDFFKFLRAKLPYKRAQSRPDSLIWVKNYFAADTNCFELVSWSWQVWQGCICIGDAVPVSVGQDPLKNSALQATLP